LRQAIGGAKEPKGESAAFAALGLCVGVTNYKRCERQVLVVKDRCRRVGDLWILSGNQEMKAEQFGL